MKRTAPATWAFAALVLATSISGCSSNSHNSSSPSVSASVSSPASPSASASTDTAATAVVQAVVMTRKAGSLGTILVNANGRSMYLFEADTSSKSTCYQACAAAWPPVLTSGKPKAGSGVQSKLLGTTTRTGGATQVTYNGHPVYLYSGDSAAGDTHGQGLTQFGAKWYVLNPDGKKVDNS